MQNNPIRKTIQLSNDLSPLQYSFLPINTCRQFFKEMSELSEKGYTLHDDLLPKLNGQLKISRKAFYLIDEQKKTIVPENLSVKELLAQT